MTNKTVSQDRNTPKDDLARRELADAIRREWGRLSEHAEELSATAEAVVVAVETGGEGTRYAARLRAAALAAAATRASVVLGDVQRVAGRLEGLATALDVFQPDEPEPR
jgi:hypothetical protein